MILYIDTESRKLVQSLTSDRIAPSPQFMQGDNEPLEIHLLLRGTSNLYEDKILNLTTDFLRVAVARFKGDPKLLTITSTYEPLENGGVIVMLPLNTVEIETALGNNPSLDAYFEVEYSTSAGRVTTVLQTSCKLKNDLIADAPNVEIQPQFYNKTECEATFLQKSDNLESLTDKPTARENLDIYSKSEVYPKSEVYTKDETNSKDALNLKQSENLSDLANKDEARHVLQVPHKSKLVPLGFYGVYSDSAFSRVGGNYGDGIGTLSQNFTIMTTFLCDAPNSTIFSSQYSDYNELYFALSNSNSTVIYGYIYDYDSETGTDNSRNLSFNLSKPIDYGDKLIISVQDRVLKVYKNTELVGERQIEPELYIYQLYNILSYKGLKKNFIYTPSLAIPVTSAEGRTQRINYSIEDFVNDIPPPQKLFNGIFHRYIYSYPEAYYGYLGEAKATTQTVFNGVYYSMKVYANPRNSSHYIQLLKYTDKPALDFGRYKLRFKVYIPSSNTNLKRLQLRISNYALTSSMFNIVSSSNVDASGFITATDAWTTVEIDFKQKNSYSGYPHLYMYKAGATTSFGSANEGNDEVFYIANLQFEGLEGLELFYQGGLQTGVWKNCSSRECDLGTYNPVSYPADTKTTIIKTIEVASFQNYIYEYFDASLEGLELRQIILKFDSNVPDTSNLEYEYDRNLFRLYLSGYVICNELIPAVNAQAAFNIYPKFGLSYSSFSSIQVDSMYSCSCGGKIILIFTKI